jgi:hypothetical protein
VPADRPAPDRTGPDQHHVDNDGRSGTASTTPQHRLDVGSPADLDPLCVTLDA